MSSDLSVINEALIRLGATPLASLEDGSAQALVAASTYETCKHSLLADHPWHFATREVALARLSLPDEERFYSGYQYAYQLPVVMLRALGLRDGDYFQIASDQLLTNSREARLVYIHPALESVWPAYFRRLVVLETAAAFALALTESAQRADMFYREAARMAPRARAIDSQQTPPHIYNLMRIYARRRGNPLTQP